MRLAVRQLRILQTTKSFERCPSPVIDISDEMWILWLVGKVRAVLLEEGRGLFELLERPVRDGFTERYVPPERPVEFIELREPVVFEFEFRVGCYLQIRSSNLLFKRGG